MYMSVNIGLIAKLTNICTSAIILANQHRRCSCMADRFFTFSGNELTIFNRTAAPGNGCWVQDRVPRTPEPVSDKIEKVIKQIIESGLEDNIYVIRIAAGDAATLYLEGILTQEMLCNSEPCNGGFHTHVHLCGQARKVSLVSDKATHFHKAGIYDESGTQLGTWITW